MIHNIKEVTKIKCIRCDHQIYDPKSINPDMCRVNQPMYYSGIYMKYPLARICNVYNNGKIAITMFSGGAYQELESNQIYCCECGVKEMREE